MLGSHCMGTAIFYLFLFFTFLLEEGPFGRPMVKTLGTLLGVVVTSTFLSQFLNFPKRFLQQALHSFLKCLGDLAFFHLWYSIQAVNYSNCNKVCSHFYCKCALCLLRFSTPVACLVLLPPSASILYHCCALTLSWPCSNLYTCCMSDQYRFSFRVFMPALLGSLNILCCASGNHGNHSPLYPLQCVSLPVHGLQD